MPITMSDKRSQGLDKLDGASIKQNRYRRKSTGLTILGRLLWLPGLLVHWLRMRDKENISKAQLDHELRLYAEMFPGGFLHYGYFEDDETEAAHISFADLDAAQHRYAQDLVELIGVPDSPVLDVGCGMGGLSFMLADRGLEVIPLSPDHHQVAHIQEKRPSLKVIHGRFEDFVAAGYEEYFGTVVTSESLQYLDLDQALPRIRGLLKPGGQWIICDYFRIDDDEKSSGHLWADFRERIEAQGFAIRHEEDITGHILPTLRFATMLAERFVQPTVRYSENKLASKRPLLHYILETVFRRLRSKMDKGMQSIDPAHFAAHKRYMRLVIETRDG